MADYIQSLDPRNLVILETALVFLTSPFAAPPYNLPIFLFGVYAQENSESNQSLKLFTALLGGSALFDIIWMASNTQGWFIKTLSVLILLLKAPTFFAFLTALRQRGEQFSGLNIRGGDLSGPTVWTMPGGFTSLGGSRNGYEPVDAERDVEAHPKPAPHVVPQVHQNPVQNQPPPSTQAPGGYQAM